jgi:hypothetical protein
MSTARIDSGHHMAEENPQQLAEELLTFALALTTGHAEPANKRHNT